MKEFYSTVTTVWFDKYKKLYFTMIIEKYSQ